MSGRTKTKEIKADLLKHHKLWRRGKEHGQVERASYDNGDEWFAVRLENVDLDDGQRVSVQIGGDEILELIISRRQSRGQISTSGSHRLPTIGEGDTVDVMHDTKVMFRGTFKSSE